MPVPVSDAADLPAETDDADPVFALVRRQRRQFYAKRIGLTLGAIAGVAGFIVLLTYSWWAAIVLVSFFILAFFLLPLAGMLAPFAATLLANFRVRRARLSLGPATKKTDLRHLSQALRVLVLDARTLLLTIEDPLSESQEIERLLWDWLHRVEGLGEADRAWLERVQARTNPLRAALDHTKSGKDVTPRLPALRETLTQWVLQCSSPPQRMYR